MLALTFTPNATLTDSEKDTLRVEALNLAAGETTYRSKCPRCHHSVSFSLTRGEQGILYHCFRNKCGVRGFISTSPHSAYNECKPKTEKPKLNPFKDPLVRIPDNWQNWLLETYEITKEDCRQNSWMYDERNQRIAMPINNLYGWRSGVSCKRLPGSPYTGPKVVHYWESEDNIKLHFPYTKSELNKIVVVEDIISATKIAKIMPSVALLGTNMSKVQAAFLAKNYNQIILALDPDALSKSVAIRKKYGAMFGQISIIALSDDPKDMLLEDLVKIFKP